MSKIKYLENKLNKLKEELNHIETKINLQKKKNQDEITLLNNNFNYENILTERNRIQTQIINNQNILIGEFNNYNTKSNFELNELQNKIKELDEANDKIKFYQDDNIRLSSTINDTQKKYEIIRDNLNKTEKEKNDIFKQIQELNNSLLKNNIIGSPFLKEKVKENSINSKILNKITETNLKDEKESSESKDLNILVNDIFK